jgi:hypothetical protein
MESNPHQDHIIHKATKHTTGGLKRAIEMLLFRLIDKDGVERSAKINLAADRAKAKKKK